MAEIKFTTVNDLLTVFGKKFVDDLGKSLDAKKDATGKLRGSIRFQTKIFTERYEFNLLMEDYYKWVDEGRQAGKKAPPINPNVLMKWIQDKKIRPRAGSKLPSRKAKGFNMLAATKSLAFLIGRKISKFGIKPTYFFSDVFDDGRMDKLKVDLGNGLKKDILIEIREIAKEK